MWNKNYWLLYFYTIFILIVCYTFEFILIYIRRKYNILCVYFISPEKYIYIQIYIYISEISSWCIDHVHSDKKS